MSNSESKKLNGHKSSAASGSGNMILNGGLDAQV